jgi:surface antigen
VNQELRSPDGTYRLQMQGDGNLVATHIPSGTVVWNTGTSGNPNSILEMQAGDGNLVLYRTNGTFSWNSNTQGSPGATLDIQNDGNVVVRTRDGRATWSWKTGRTGSSRSALGSAQSLGPNQFLESGDGAIRLTMQGDGNLVLRRTATGAVIWNTGTSGNAGASLVLQGSDGNLVLYRTNGTAAWNSQTPNMGVTWLGLQGDGNAVLHGGSGPIWSVYTGLLGAKGTRGQTTTRNTGAAGNCTWWVYERSKDAIGVYPLITGDAKDMGNNARNRGWTVTATPRARSIMVRQPGVGGASGSYGHVMWVKQVSGNRVLISDMNWSGLYSVRDNVWLDVASSDRFILID